MDPDAASHCFIFGRIISRTDDVMNAIELHGLKKTYANGTVALKNIDFQVKEGDFCALLGANGAGKTTIIGILTGLINRTAGGVKVFGMDLDQSFVQIKKMIGVVPQEMNFNIFEKVQDIVVNQAGFFGISRPVALERSVEILKRLELWDKRSASARHLSGGMKRRLMIARALINHPRLLILDEPTAGVDVELRHSMWNFLRELNRSGTTILLTTHYLEEVEQMCRHAGIIKNGEIIIYDSVRKLLKLLETETYVVHVDRVTDLEKLREFQPKPVDDQTFEIDHNKTNSLQEFMKTMEQAGMVMTDIRPKGNRMEQMYLRLLA